MDSFSLWVILKITTIICGFCCVFMGYKLLIKGIFPADSDIEVGWDKDRRLVLRRASPGVIFAVIGFGIIGLTTWFGVYKGSDILAQANAPKEPSENARDKPSGRHADVKDEKSKRPAIESKE